MGYQAMWERLHEELWYLANQGVKAIHPHLLLGYMNFIKEVESHKHEQGDKG